ncbi:MAG: response regulator [Alphaproteobacteria bacterium]|jgi:DNA-binding NarL/FixJ family response regulator|nr:response regulator [Alphaproteobacteria bacterium]
MRVLLADDHGLLRDSIQAYLQKLDPQALIDTAADLDESLELARGLKPYDLVLLDLDMPGMDGFAGIAKMREIRPGVPVAILSGESRRERIQQAIAQGAASFIPKSLTGSRLLHVLKLVISGETYIPAFAFGGGPEARPGVGPDPVAALGKAEAFGLSRREAQVLGHLAQGRSNKEIARALDLQEVTIKLHMRGLFRKLTARNRTQALKRAYDLDLID